jgi:protein-S-isoprenylcysteine O-methyltransferase Ste14
MPVHSYFVFVAFVFLFAAFSFQYIRVRSPRAEFLGRPSIERLYFFSGKFALFTTWILLIVKAINPRLGFFEMPTGFSWLAVGLLYSGVLIITISLINLGKSLAVGLPQQETKLQTGGLYRFSRNPLYVGAFLISLASCIYFPDLINISFAIFGICIHHQIIRQEERFLSERFGSEWIIYSTKVGRYI